MQKAATNRYIVGIIACVAMGSAHAAAQTIPTTRAETNKPAYRPLQLSPAAAKLNRSQYFQSRVYDSKQLAVHELYNNWLEEHLEHKLDFGVIMSVPEAGPPEIKLTLASFSRALDWPGLGTNWMTLTVDGKTVLARLPGKSNYSGGNQRVRNRREETRYSVEEYVLRSLAGARQAELKVEGNFNPIQRSLDATNIARFKLFVQTYLDSKATTGGKTGQASGKWWHECQLIFVADLFGVVSSNHAAPIMVRALAGW